jgi:two-component system copper resistance phosphate regulon response regulator CusR
MKVLIIEDEKKLARLLKQGLEENGFTVDLAHDGADGQYRVENYAYDAVLLDLMLPEVDGLTILASLRNQGSDVPVLIITARGEVEDRIRGWDSNVIDVYISYLRTKIDKGYPAPLIQTVRGAGYLLKGES